VERTVQGSLMRLQNLTAIGWLPSSFSRAWGKNVKTWETYWRSKLCIIMYYCKICSENVPIKFISYKSLFLNVQNMMFFLGCMNVEGNVPFLE